MNEKTVSAGLDLAIEAMTRAVQVSTIVRAAQAAGRTTLTDEEWGAINDADSQARAELVRAIASKTPSPA